MVAFDDLLSVQYDRVSREKALQEARTTGFRHYYITTNRGAIYTGVVVYIGPRYNSCGHHVYEELLVRYGYVEMAQTHPGSG